MSVDKKIAGLWSITSANGETVQVGGVPESNQIFHCRRFEAPANCGRNLRVSIRNRAWKNST